MIRNKINFLHHSDISFNQKEIVFFSYRHIDIGACNSVVEFVKGIPNVAIWIDEQLSAGEYYDEEIQEALRLSDSMLLVVTSNYFMEGSYTMERELPFAKQINLPIVAVVCEAISGEMTTYLQERVDYLCSLQEPNSIRTAFLLLHNKRKESGLRQTFLQLTKRIDTWYLTVDDMYQLAYGYYYLTKSGDTNLIPKALTLEKAKQYARCAEIAGVSGAETLLHQLGERK